MTTIRIKINFIADEHGLYNSKATDQEIEVEIEQKLPLPKLKELIEGLGVPANTQGFGLEQDGIFTDFDWYATYEEKTAGECGMKDGAKLVLLIAEDVPVPWLKPKMMSITIICADDLKTTIPVTVVDAHTGAHLKAYLEPVIGYTPDRLRFVLNGQWLERDDKPLGNYGVQDGAVIHVVPRLRGS